MSQMVSLKKIFVLNYVIELWFVWINITLPHVTFLLYLILICHVYCSI